MKVVLVPSRMKKPKQLLLSVRQWLADAFSLIFPRVCANCGARLLSSESFICTSCYVSLPFTNLQGRRGNVLEKLFWGKFPIERVHSWLRYHSGEESTGLVLKLKYNNRPQIGLFMGEIIANELLNTDFFSGVDAIIAVPLHKNRLVQRGYNQSAKIAQGVSNVTHIPVLNDVVERVVDNTTQTRLSRQERRENVEHIFALVDAEQVEHKHILLIDDTLTTGSTIISCAQELCRAEGVRVSVLTAYVATSIIDLHPRIQTRVDS